MPKKRQLTLLDFDEVIAEITRLRDEGYSQLGKWNLSQMGEHLTKTMRLGLDGTAPASPWIMRKIAGMMFACIVSWRWMPGGAPAPEIIQPQDTEADITEKIDTCLATLAEARDFPGPLPPYRLADGMTLDRWKKLMVIHAQHHLRYLLPETRNHE